MTPLTPPHLREGTPQEQLRQLQSYLTQLTRELNLWLLALESQQK